MSIWSIDEGDKNLFRYKNNPKYGHWDSTVGYSFIIYQKYMSWNVYRRLEEWLLVGEHLVDWHLVERRLCKKKKLGERSLTARSSNDRSLGERSLQGSENVPDRIKM